MNVTGNSIVGGGIDYNNSYPGGTGVFQQTGGIHQVGSNLIVGQAGTGTDPVAQPDAGGQGTYQLKGGSLTVTGNTVVGDGNATVAGIPNAGGTGLFTQDNSMGDSTHSATGDLILGQGMGSSGTYTMTDSGTGNALSLIVGGDVVVGQVGTGTFTQDSGDKAGVNITGSLLLGGNQAVDLFANMGSGTYELKSGTLAAASTTVGDVGTGVFSNSGGIHETGYLSLGSVGSGGGNSFGTYNLSGGGVLNDTGGADVGVFGRGVINQTGGTATIGTVADNHNLQIGIGPETPPDPLSTYPVREGIYALSSGNLTVNGNTVVGLGNSSFTGEPGGKGTFTQNGGSHTTTGTLIVGQGGDIGGGNGHYELSGGSLTVTGNTVVGDGAAVSGTGTFAQTGGTHTANNLVVGNRSDGTGTYVMSGGDLGVNGSMYVGLGHNDFPATGTVDGLFQQSAGTVTAAQMFVGGFTEIIPDPTDPVNNPPTFIRHFGTGRYELSGGEANSSFTVVGTSSNGQVQQTGGIFNAGSLVLGNDGLFSINNGSGVDFYSSGVYDLQGGVLNTTSTTISVFGLGTFNQSGASQHNVGGNLVVGSQPAYVEPNSGQVDQGKYNLSDGTLSVQGNTIIGAG